MNSDLFINIKKSNHDLSDREKLLLNLLFIQSIISINEQVTHVPLGLHEQEILDEDLLHHHLAFTSEVDSTTLENLKESINAGVFAILETCGIDDFNINYYYSK